MVNFVRQATKKSLLSFLKNPKEADSREWRRLFDALLFKDELESYLDGGGTSTGGSSGSTSSPLGAFLKKDGSTKLTSDWDAGSQKIRAKTLQSDVPTGTAPLTVASTTKVTNLNADTVDGKSETAFVLIDGTRALTSDWDAGSNKITAEQLESDVATSTAPLIVASTTVVSNLNVDQVDGKDSTDLLLVDGTQDSTGDQAFTAGLTVGNGVNDVDVSAGGLLTFQGTADIAAAVDQKIVFRSYIDVKARNGEYSLHGGINALDTAHDLGAGDLVVTCGTGKIMLSINAGADVVGDITITGTTVDRDTGAETGADTDVLTIDAVTTDNSSTDALGNTIHEFVGAYITSKWFKGSITITSADTDVTDMDTYQVAFDQMDDSPGITLKTFDITATATNTAAWLYAYLYTLHVTGDKCNVDTESSIDLPAAEVTANMTYRLRRGEINESFSGATDGFWVEMFPGPLANTYWENINVQVYANIKRDVYGESS